ncbi:MAG TPA: hypothetical protein VIF43_00910 [Patescibacteria group bacterium]|jgi:hypothetical protein
MAESTEQAPTLADLYPDLDEEGLRFIRPKIDGRHVPEQEAAVEAAIIGGYFDEEGRLDSERLEAYRRLESELADSKGGLVVLASAPAPDSGAAAYKVSICRLAEDQVIDGRHGKLAADKRFIVKAVLGDEVPFLMAHGELHDGEPLVDQDHDVAGPVAFGPDDQPRLTEVMPADDFVDWLERSVEDPRMRYVLLAEFYAAIPQLGSGWLPDLTVPKELEPYITAERTALNDYRAFYEEVSQTNRGFVRNGLTRGNLQPLIDKRETFAAREQELRETHAGIAWRLDRTVLHEARGWQHITFDADGMYKWEVGEQLKALKREAKEMERRLDVVGGQSAAVTLMERALELTDGATA